MASINSYAVVTKDLKGLLDATDRNPEVQPILETERQALAGSLAEIQGLKARQEELTALRQEATQRLKDAVNRAKETAIRIRSVVRGKIGPRSELLVHFNVSPLRKRPRKKKEEKKPNGENPGTDSGAMASPSVKPVA
ncbi:MAG TPA: hypothetical protein VGG03_00670 [Thermoanaerobaculia bacterium]|jgi:hypothetical protein